MARLETEAEADGNEARTSGREAVEVTRRDGASGMTGETPPIRVRGLDHVTLVVRDLDASRRFFVDVLGMTEVERPDFSFDGMWLQAGANQIHFILEHERSSPAGNQVPEAQRRGPTHHFAFAVEDARAFKDRLDELGVTVLSGPVQRPDGATQVFVCDPDGHVVELCSRDG